MAFDLSTAKPVNSGFDLSTAKPVDAQPAQPDFINEDVPTTESLAALQQQNIDREQAGDQTTIGQKLSGAGEAVLTLLTGATTGAAGFGLGTLEGVLQGLPPEEAQEVAKRYAAQLTFEPKSETGQEIVSSITGPLSTLPPVLGVTRLQTLKPLIQGKPLTERVLKNPKSRKQLLIDEIKSGNPSIDAVTKALDDDGKLITRPASVKALKVLGGGDAEKRTISVLENANPATKRQVRQQLSIIEQGNRDARFRNENRPSDILGQSMLDRAQAITKKNEVAGKQIGNIANKLSDTTVNISEPKNEFFNSLSEMGVTFNRGDDGWVTPDFSRSKFIGGSQKDMAVLINDLLNDTPDFNAAHKLKRAIRDNVDFDKGGTGQLKGQSEKLLKDLSRNIDDILDSTSPEYKKANETFAKTVKLKDDFDRLAGKDIDINSEIAAKALGAKGMRLVSNAESRVQIQQVLNNTDKVLKDLGVRFKDDLPSLVHMTAELNNIFKLAPSGSLKGNLIDAGLDVTEAVTSPIAAGRAISRKVNELKAPDFNKKIRALKALTNTQEKK
jgi:hypothetical protein